MNTLAHTKLNQIHLSTIQRTSSHRCSKEFLVGVERKSKKVVYVENKSVTEEKKKFIEKK